jgi:hypothetical protein
MKILTGALALTSVMSAGAAAQFGEPIYHYEGEMTADVETGFVDLDWRISVLDPEAESVTFLLAPSLGNIAVGGDIAGFETGEQGPFQAIVIALEPSGGAVRTIKLGYDGVLFPEPPNNEINAVAPDRVELSVDGFWLPIDATFQGYLTADLTVDVGAPWLGVANGTVEQLPTGARIRNDDASLDIAFTMAPDFRVTEADGFTLYDLRDTDTGTDQLIEAASFCFNYLDPLYGENSPLPEAHFVIHRRSESAYNRRSYITLTDISDTEDQPLTQFLCHELAHHWSMGANFNSVENWLNESFADQAGNMGVRERFGEDAFIARMNRYRARIEGQELPPIWVPGATERPPYMVSYLAGPVALWELEVRIGRPRFAEFMRRYMTDPVNTTPDLLDMLEEVAGREDRVWFEARLGRATP